ncbi:hypothetical protein D5S17_23335 [Pseudonocardiaceae bacterium YIM PH 21723]|nr:hypothetical protein D5S17_23335 [Pseudonocardiaceae bacterium YIM PH 21723]
MIDQTRDEMRRADAMAGVQIVLLAGIAAMVGQIGAALPRSVLMIAALAAIPAAASVWFASLALLPRGVTGKKAKSVSPAPGSWVHILRSGSDCYTNYAAERLDRLQLGVLQQLAPLTHRKFLHVRRAWICLWATLLILLVALVVGYGLALGR